MSDKRPQPNKNILAMPAYVGGKTSADINAKVKQIYKLSANESAIGASPKALAALQAAQQNIDPALYPDGSAAELRAALAGAYNLDAANIVCGSGSGELLLLLARGYIGAGDEFIYCEHGFLLYKLAGLAAGATPIMVAERDLTIDVAAVLAAITPKTKLIFIANPNNPTGTCLSHAEIKTLHKNISSEILLVIDEAYGEYVEAADYAKTLAYAQTTDNIIITRTFSKAYGLAGLRLGWAACPPAVAKVLNLLRPPFNVSSVALVAGVAAVGDTEHIKQARAHNRKWRDWFAQELAQAGISLRPSLANFILLEFSDVAEANAAEDFLCAAGVIPRGLAAYNLPHALRLTIGSEAATRAALAALIKFSKNKRENQ